MKYLRSAIWILALISVANLAHAQVGQLLECEALRDLAVPSAAIRLPSGRVSVDSAVAVAAQGRTTSESGEILLELPAHCRVQGAIAAVDPAAPPIPSMRMPRAWRIWRPELWLVF